MQVHPVVKKRTNLSIEKREKAQLFRHPPRQTLTDTSISPMTREEFDVQFAEYRRHLREEVLRFRDFVAVYLRIRQRKTDHLAALNLAPAFFQIVESSLFSSIVLWADKLFDEHGERGVFNFLLFIENNRKWLTIKELQIRRDLKDDHWTLRDRKTITLKTIGVHRARVCALEGLPSFRLLRDKFHAHFDKKYFFDPTKITAEAPLQPEDLVEAGLLAGEIINAYSVDFDGKTYDWETTNVEDLDFLLDRAHRRPLKRVS
jgi:hypothetical protein